MDIDVQITTCKMDIGVQIINILVNVLLFGHSNLDTNVHFTIVIIWTPLSIYHSGYLDTIVHFTIVIIWTPLSILP